jgi:hypothetical protein
MAVDSIGWARTQAVCWLPDELFDAEDDLLALLARGAIGGWRREGLEGFCELVGDAVAKAVPETSLAGKNKYRPLGLDGRPGAVHDP